jgi:hypothetical protein
MAHRPGNRNDAADLATAPDRRNGRQEGAPRRALGRNRARCRVIPIHNVKQRSLLRSRGALLRPGFAFLFSIRPVRGGRSAGRRSTTVVARFGARRAVPSEARRASSGTRSPLGAPPWRFWAGGRASFSGISSGSVQRAPRSQVVMPGGRGPGPPGAIGYEPRPQDATPRSAFGSSPEDGPSDERGCAQSNTGARGSQVHNVVVSRVCDVVITDARSSVRADGLPANEAAQEIRQVFLRLTRTGNRSRRSTHHSGR